MLQEKVSVELIDVLLYREKHKKVHTGARDFCALSLRLSGGSVFRTEEGPLSAPEGSVTFIPASLGYDRTTDGETTAVFHFLLHDPRPSGIAVFAPQDPERYRAVFLEALDVWEKKPKGYRFAATALFYRLLSMMEEDGVLFGEDGNGLAERAAEYLCRHYRERDLTVAAVAARFYVSEAYLRKKFRERYGYGPKHFLERTRITNAISLLRTGYFTQTEVADRCGYSDVKYFRAVFKGWTGRSIGEYLKRPPGERQRK